MSKKERQRKVILEQVLSKQMSRVDATKRLGISSRQLKRILSRYMKYSDEGLVHKSRGKPSGRAIGSEIKALAISTYQEKYDDFGPTLASEKLLEEEGIRVHAETLRLWLKEAHLWQPHRKRKQHRMRRARRARYGELLQLDGSIHAWFDGKAEKQCLMNMVDDATGKTLALLDTGETTRAAFALLRWWIKEAGIPLAIYVDLKSLYVAPKALRQNEEGELVDPEWLTHFSRACKKLGIEVIKAYSPQAKGRVERNHAVYQDRFVKELRLKGISTIEGANELLSQGFVNKLNDKFAKPANNPEDAHVALLPEDDLEQIFCWEYTRQVKNDSTVQWQGEHYQIEKPSLQAVRPKQKILIREHIDGNISMWSHNKKLAFYKIEQRAITLKKAPMSQESLSEIRSKASTQNRHKTPWGQFNPAWLKKPSQANVAITP